MALWYFKQLLFVFVRPVHICIFIEATKSRFYLFIDTFHHFLLLSNYQQIPTLVVKLIEVFSQFQLHMVFENTRGTKQFFFVFSQLNFVCKILHNDPSNIVKWSLSRQTSDCVKKNKLKAFFFPSHAISLKFRLNLNLKNVVSPAEARNDHLAMMLWNERAKRERRFVIAESRRRWASWVIWQINFIIVTCSAHLVLFDRRYSPAQPSALILHDNGVIDLNTGAYTNNHFSLASRKSSNTSVLFNYTTRFLYSIFRFKTYNNISKHAFFTAHS